MISFTYSELANQYLVDRLELVEIYVMTTAILYAQLLQAKLMQCCGPTDLHVYTIIGKGI